jgi:lysine 2,3-aminomutase
VQKTRKLGINIYNQQVSIYYNSRKFETAFLRKTIKVCGIDPYYTFNCQDKDETVYFRVPIARRRKGSCPALSEQMSRFLMCQDWGNHI